MASNTVRSTSAHVGIEELTADLSASPYYSDDMAPVPRSRRRWGTRDMAVLWISMSACVPTYMLASGLIDAGMNWWQAVLTIFLGNVIVLMPMVLNAPCRHEVRHSLSGVLPGIVRNPRRQRAGAAAGAGGVRLVRHPDVDRRRGRSTRFCVEFIPAWEQLPRMQLIDINVAQVGCFLFFWAINMWVVYKGIESIRVLLNIKAPLLIALGLVLLGVGVVCGERVWSEMLSQPVCSLRTRRTKAGSSGRSSLPRSRRMSDSGPRCRSTSPISVAMRTRSATRWSARRWACRRRWRCTRSSAWR